MTKRISALIAAILLMLSLAACGESAANPAVTPDSGDSATIAPPVRETEPAAPTISDSGSLGEYDVTIKEFELVQDYSGAPAILIHYSFTNNSDENRSAAFTISVLAFQNGISLEPAVIMDDSVYDSQASMKDIQPGATIEAAEAFSLTSDTAPVICYASEIFSFDNSLLSKTYDIAPDGTTVFSVAPGVENAVPMGDASVSINSYDIVKDHDGQSVLVLNMGYTNNGRIYEAFYSTIAVKAFQNGIELETQMSLLLDDADAKDMGNSTLSVLPGAGLGVSEAFVLTSDTDPITIEISEQFSFSSEKITTQIDPAQ